MTPIPDEIMEQARALLVDVRNACNTSSVQHIAQALLAAEKRGEERERERWYAKEREIEAEAAAIRSET
jgi:hypothetical protein